jgi:hypothetical protein
LVIEPCTSGFPKVSDGIRPTNAPMVLPVNRCRSPISTASASAVRLRLHEGSPAAALTG